MRKKINRHIIIAGTPRAGKTTLCIELVKHGFIHYKMDSIKRGICDAFGFDSHDWSFINPKIAQIINTIIVENSTDTVAGLEYYAIDSCHVFPKDVSLFSEDVLVVYLGYADISVSDKLKEMRFYDKDNYWCSKVDDDTLVRMIEANINLSKELKNECKKYNIKYFDTSSNRDKVLNEALEFILEECTK